MVNTLRGIQRRGTGSWIALARRVREDGIVLSERLLGEFSGPGSKLAAIREAGTNTVLPPADRTMP